MIFVIKSGSEVGVGFDKGVGVVIKKKFERKVKKIAVALVVILILKVLPWAKSKKCLSENDKNGT